MLVDWKYIYRRRNWSVDLVISGLAEKTWQGFQEFHSSRGIEVPPKELFDAALAKTKPAPAASKPQKQNVKAEKPKQPTRRKRSVSRKKEVASESAEKGKK